MPSDGSRARFCVYQRCAYAVPAIERQVGGSVWTSLIWAPISELLSAFVAHVAGDETRPRFQPYSLCRRLPCLRSTLQPRPHRYLPPVCFPRFTDRSLPQGVSDVVSTPFTARRRRSRLRVLLCSEGSFRRDARELSETLAVPLRSRAGSRATYRTRCGRRSAVVATLRCRRWVLPFVADNGNGRVSAGHTTLMSLCEHSLMSAAVETSRRQPFQEITKKAHG